MLSPQFHDDIKKLADQMDRESVQKWVRDEVKKRMEAARKDIGQGMWYWVRHASGADQEALDEALAARVRVNEFLDRVEEELVKLAETQP